MTQNTAHFILMNNSNRQQQTDILGRHSDTQLTVPSNATLRQSIYIFFTLFFLEIPRTL